ncbi:MAG: hypothetical protein M9910_09005 [Kiritimatiellae bacterium]|nr:hypothetical protein [Kiritimatiellia bacterium]
MLTRVRSFASDARAQEPRQRDDALAAAAIGLEGGEEVEWELLDRGELHLIRMQPATPKGRARKLRGFSAEST